jgi:hypothetical protein
MNSRQHSSIFLHLEYSDCCHLNYRFITQTDLVQIRPIRFTQILATVFLYFSTASLIHLLLKYNPVRLDHLVLLKYRHPSSSMELLPSLINLLPKLNVLRLGQFVFIRYWQPSAHIELLSQLFIYYLNPNDLDLAN